LPELSSIRRVTAPLAARPKKLFHRIAEYENGIGLTFFYTTLYRSLTKTPQLAVSLLMSPNGDSMGDIGFVSNPMLTKPLLFKAHFRSLIPSIERYSGGHTDQLWPQFWALISRVSNAKKVTVI